jgi:predicted dehydrogenase
VNLAPWSATHVAAGDGADPVTVSSGLRLGVVGLKMGLHLADWSQRIGLRVVAGCDRDPETRAAAAGRLPGADLTGRWEDLLELDLDGVVLANDFDAHAPLAMEFLEQGVHVLSESAACTTEKEGRRLVEAADASAATYSLAENYVAHPHVRAIREEVDRGEVGRVELIEADYLHGMSPEMVDALVGEPSHWRGRIAPTAYCTHTLSPVLAITGARPVEVTAFTVDETNRRAAVVMAVRLSTGALAVTRHGFLQGEPESHWSWVSVRGSRGLVESGRGPGERAWSVRVRTEGWASDNGEIRDEERTPPPLFLAGTEVERRVEGTALMLTAFRATIQHGAPPLVPVRPAVAASLVGVMGAQSLANGSRPVPVPSID